MEGSATFNPVVQMAFTSPSPSITVEQVAGIHFTFHIRQVLAPAIGDDHVSSIPYARLALLDNPEPINPELRAAALKHRKLARDFKDRRN